MGKRKRAEDDVQAPEPEPEVAVEKPTGPQTSHAGVPFVPPAGAGFTK